MKKIMTLAVIALASVAMVACCGQQKKCKDACCDKPATECATCEHQAECPQAAEVAPAAETPAPEVTPAN